MPALVGLREAVQQQYRWPGAANLRGDTYRFHGGISGNSLSNSARRAAS